MLKAVSTVACGVTAVVVPKVGAAASCCCPKKSGSVNGDFFTDRHIGPTDKDVEKMLLEVSAASKAKFSTLDDLTNFAIPANIKAKTGLSVGEEKGEHEALAELQAIAKKNKLLKSFIGMGYNACIIPQVILRNVLLNPGWYTPYTPYQAEVSQGRLEAMLAFQTLVSDMTGMHISTCSLLDEGTAAAEAMRMCLNNAKPSKSGRRTILVADTVHPQVIDVIKTRAEPFGVDVKVADPATFDFAKADGFIGTIAAYPNTYGTAEDLTDLVKKTHAAGGLFVASTDILALALLKEPAKYGVDVVVGSTGRLGCTLGYGGAHAAFLGTSDKLKRTMPGRIIGVSKDTEGALAYRMALGTREQHIRREKATSNICTASALMCQLSAFYCMYHGPEGIKRIAKTIHCRTRTLAETLKRAGFCVRPGTFFDTVVVTLPSAKATRAVHERARAKGYNLRELPENRVGISFDETTTDADVVAIVEAVCGPKAAKGLTIKHEAVCDVPKGMQRESPFMTHPLFNKNHSETEMMRYLFELQTKDIGLNSRGIFLGSCTMKLNAASIMAPITWPEFADVHPFVPLDQAAGYTEMIRGLERALCDVTGFDACSVQPNSGASGEYAGLLTIRNYLKSKGQLHRNVCLLPVSAHGTNPATAAMAAFETVIVKCDKAGNIDVADFRAKAEKHANKLACAMMTYPSTHGVYEETFKECAAIVHKLGGMVYMDGANMNAQVGLIKPSEIGADVCHLNLHKTFAMPHGGGGPGMGPICCTKTLAPFLPGHCVVKGVGGGFKVGAVSSAPWGSASILPISWMYTKMLGSRGLRKSTQVAILNANYMAARLKKHYDLVYTGPGGSVAHEFILDLRPFGRCGIEATDVAKRLIDYGFHAPTLSFPVAGTLMIEPTESEPLAELDRFCDAMIAIREEIAAIERGELDRVDNPLRNAPHTAAEVTSDKWTHKYSRKLAAFPLPVVEKSKYWAPVKRVDNAWGDLHLKPTLPRADE